MSSPDPLQGVVTGEVLDASPRPVYGARRLLPVDLGAAIRAARVRLHLNSAQAAMLAGISAGHMRRIERAEVCPSRAVAVEIVNVLPLEPDVAERLLAVAAADAGRSYPGRPDQGAETRRSRYRVAAVLASAVGITDDEPNHEAAIPLGPTTRPRLPSGQSAVMDRAAGSCRGGDSLQSAGVAGGCDLSLDRQNVDA